MDELFAEDNYVDTRSKNRFILFLLIVAIPLIIAGLISCTIIPGAFLNLWAYIMAKKEMELIENGDLPVELSVNIARLKMLSGIMLVVTALILVLQVKLLTSGFYKMMLLNIDSKLIQ